MTTPTPAQIEALEFYADPHNYSHTDKGVPVANDNGKQARAALASAAEVGEHKPYRITDRMLADCLDREKTVEARTIERCAQVADTFDAELDPATYTASDIAAAIRALKGRP